MRWKQGAAVCVVLVLAAAGTGKEGKEVADPIKGTWTVESILRDGQDVDDAKGDKVTFGGGKLMIKTKDRDQEGTYKVDPSGKPATIDVVPGEGPNAGKTLKGIYRVKGDELTICIPVNADSARPKEFEGKEGSGLMLVSLKRDKP
jgi:uncharacterized protein (TIGR03067 family)